MKKVMKVLCVTMVVLGLIVSQAYAMTEEQKLLCHGIIHSASAAGAGSAAALAQAPGTDNLALAAILGTMTVGLAKVFDISFGQTSAESIGISLIAYYGGTIAARTLSQWLAGWIPLAGNTLNMLTMAGLIEYIGWEVANAFDSGKWVSWSIALKIGVIVTGSKEVPLPAK